MRASGEARGIGAAICQWPVGKLRLGQNTELLACRYRREFTGAADCL
jgi:hypothetical protein